MLFERFQGQESECSGRKWKWIAKRSRRESDSQERMDAIDKRKLIPVGMGREPQRRLGSSEGKNTSPHVIGANLTCSMSSATVAPDITHTVH